MAKAKWQSDFERLMADPTIWDSLTPAVQKALIDRGLVTEAGALIEQASPDGWDVEYLVLIKEKESWHKQYSPIGEKLHFERQDEAEQAARELSVLNQRVFRVVQYAISPAFIVYEFGQKFIQDGLTGIRTRMESSVFTQDDNDTEGDLYYLQGRNAQGRSQEWSISEPRAYVDAQNAADGALSLSRANGKREYRVIVGESNLSPEPVVYRVGRVWPDTECLTKLCAVVDGGDTPRGLVTLFVLWKGSDVARTLIKDMYQEVMR